ncbi:two-component sensor histidine kinase [Bacillus sp. FJAT-49732]|uniref:histidine kinase n=1 Tax=Lederbergia citrisecunda TaxID=2833583 RepID=A0A942YK28_9BACI|nr:HAMP domain-containing sensor histidine kinase [Lederbergia citrisecunda]MBS4198170.1 two-component sensor histidine kinase [Lederbergia citrisecunda]
MKFRIKMVLGFLSIILLLSLCWSAAYFLSDYLYQYFNIALSNFLIQLINSLLGFFIFGCCMYLLSHIFSRQRERHMEFIQSIINAMRQIARGDYNVRLSKISGHEFRDDPFSQIVDNINYMSRELGQLEQMRQEFVSNVSHEIQSPLTSISGFARALQNEQLTHSERLHYLSIIETESQRLSKLSDNLLKLTSLETSHHPFELREYRLDKQLQHIVLSCEPQWSAKQIEMDLSFDKTNIIADKDLLDQVWMNLLNNAIKFTPDGGNISIKISHLDGKISVIITDTGTGISEKDQLHLFERFYKADKSRNRNTSGSGLGLSIVKKIIDMHGGTVNVTSRPNEGTTFIVTFPTRHELE